MSRLESTINLSRRLLKLGKIVLTSSGLVYLLSCGGSGGGGNPNSPTPIPTGKGTISLSITPIHESYRANSPVDVYIDNIKVDNVNVRSRTGTGVVVDNVPEGTHWLTLKGDSIEDRDLNVEVMPSLVNHYGSIQVLDKDPEGVADFLARFDAIARRGSFRDAPKYQFGTLLALEGAKIYYIDLTSMKDNPPFYINQQIDNNVKGIQVEAPKVYKRIGKELRIVYVCTGENKSNKKCDTNQMPDLGTENAYFVATDPNLRGGSINLYIKNGVNVNGQVLDNVVIGGRFRFGRETQPEGMGQDIVNLLGLYSEYRNAPDPKDSMLNELNYSDFATKIDELLGKTIEAMGPGVTSPYNTRHLGIVIPTSTSPITSAQQNSIGSIDNHVFGFEQPRYPLDQIQIGYQPPPEFIRERKDMKYRER